MSAQKACFFGTAGALLLLLTGITFPIVDQVVDTEIRQKVVLKNGSLLFDIWKAPTGSVPVYMQLYPFEVMNPDEVINGQKPFLEQRGPYTYREHREKYDIVVNDNGTVTYRENVWYEFDRSMSVGDERDTIVTVNMVLPTLANGLRFATPALQKAASFLLTLSQENLFHSISIHELVWGYDDPLLSIANKIFPDYFYTSTVGVLVGKNDTDYGLFTVYTGESDLEKLGIIDRFNGTRLLSYWTTKYANMINGSDGTLIPPYVTEKDRLYVFSPDICRSVYGVYNSSVTFKKVPVFKFIAADAVLVSSDENPDNIGFCTPQTHCLGSGVLNITECKIIDHFHLPLMISLPHFLQADEKFRQDILNMHPDPAQHTTVTMVEPLTGLLFHVAKRMQININLQNYSDIEPLKSVRSAVFPILWMNESATIDEDHAQMVYHQLTVPLFFAHIFQLVFVGISISMLILGIVFMTWYKCCEPKRIQILSERTSLIQST